jgi:hypothetical protein
MIARYPRSFTNGEVVRLPKAAHEMFQKDLHSLVRGASSKGRNE